jgi:Zn-dependent alcohol dehydrogenase
VCHSDLSVADGVFPAPLPIVLGHEAAGHVDAVGEGVDGLAPGDPVILTPVPPCGRCYWCVRGEAALCVDAAGITTNSFPDGTTGLSRGGATVYRGLNVAAFAEYVVAPASGAVKVERDVPLEIACVIGCAVQTGVGAVLNAARVEEGATVFVTGLGGIGLSVVQGARLANAAQILVSDPVAARRETAKALGATHAIDPTKEDPIAAVQQLTGGIGADYAFEAAGVAALVTQCFFAARLGGTIVVVGAPPIDQAVTLAPAALVASMGKKIRGTLLGDCNSLRDIPRLLALWRNGRLDLDALITGRRPLEEIDLAIADLRAAKGVRTVLTI